MPSAASLLLCNSCVVYAPLIVLAVCRLWSSGQSLCHSLCSVAKLYPKNSYFTANLLLTYHKMSLLMQTPSLRGLSAVGPTLGSFTAPRASDLPEPSALQHKSHQM